MTPGLLDPAWEENSIFRRLRQSYDAWSRSMDSWLEESGLEGLDRDRAQFVLNATKDVMAPVNTLAGNPEALRKVRETQGASLVQGMKNFPGRSAEQPWLSGRCRPSMLSRWAKMWLPAKARWSSATSSLS